MNRRTYLGTLAAGASLGLGGCLFKDYSMTNGVVTCADDTTQTSRDDSGLDAVEGAWPSPHFDPQNTGHDPDGRGPDGCPTTRWTFLLEEEDHVRFPPVVSGGSVFTGRQSVFALEGHSGEQRWVSEKDGGFTNGVAAVGGTVYAAKHSAVQSFDIETGARRILAEFDVAIRSPPAVVDDSIYVGMKDGSTLAVNTAGGVQWRRDLSEPDSDDAAVDVSRSPAVGNGTVYVGTRGETFHALDAAAGKPRWERSLDSSICGAPVVGDGLVYVPEEYAVRAFRTDGGETEWVLFGGDEGYVVGSPAFADGTLYVQAGPSLEKIQLLAVDAATGERRWARPIGRPEASPVVVDGTVYLDAGRVLGAFDADSGEHRWSVRPGVNQPGADIHDAVAVVGGVVFIAATSAGLLAVA